MQLSRSTQSLGLRVVGPYESCRRNPCSMLGGALRPGPLKEAYATILRPVPKKAGRGPQDHGKSEQSEDPGRASWSSSFGASGFLWGFLLGKLGKQGGWSRVEASWGF